MSLKSIFPIVVLVIVSAFQTACTNNEEALKNAKKTILNISDTDEKFKEQLNKLTANYYKLAAAVQGEEVEEIRKTAYPLISKIRDIDIMVLSDQQQLNWNLKSEMIQFSLEEIVKYDDMSEIRINFNDLSNWMHQAITEFGLTNGVTYVFECNEALEGEGAKWLSSNTDIENPYGKSHSNCGTISEQVTFE